jgi:SOS response regulatory protein OraA/RecX
MAKTKSSSDEIKKDNRKIVAIAAGVFLLLLIVFGSGAKNESSSSTPADSSASPTATATVESTPKPDVPKEYENALKKAESYLSWTNFSKEGLRHQLEFDKFESDAVDYAIQNIKADWKEQAAKQAKSYYENQNMSKDGVYDQLIFEKFTEEEAKYGVSKL